MEGKVRKRTLEKCDSIPTDEIIHGIDEKDETGWKHKLSPL